MFLNLGNCIYKEKSPRFMKLLLVKNLPNEPLLRAFSCTFYGSLTIIAHICIKKTKLQMI